MKKVISVLLSVIMIALCLTGCSGGTKMSEENVTKTVEKAFTALTEFDTKALNKYVDSSTLSTIIIYADKHDQFQKLGEAMFKNLEYKIKKIDLENQTVTVSVKNKDLYPAAYDFANFLKTNYSTFQLVTKLNNEVFLDTYLNKLSKDIDSSPDAKGYTDITLNIMQGKKNLVLSFNDESENAVSGGSLSAIKSIYSF